MDGVLLKKAMMRAQAGQDPQSAGQDEIEPLRIRLVPSEAPPWPEDPGPPDPPPAKPEAAVLGAPVAEELIPRLGTKGLSDPVNILCTQVLDRLEERGGRSLLVTSANPGEGKTFTALNLATGLSQEGQRDTLLVDAHFENPSVTRHFGLEEARGLSDFLRAHGKTRFPSVRCGSSNLSILPAGVSEHDLSELLRSARSGSLVDEMTSMHSERLLVLDAPSLLNSAGTLALSQCVDGVLLVVNAERTPSRDVRRALDVLGDRRFLGFVLNRVRD